MSHKVVSLLLCIYAVRYAAAQTGTRCPAASGRSETCVCQSQDGLIDLTSLSSKNSPKFTGMTDPNSYSYNYNPCTPFTTQGECTNVHICQKSPDGDSTFDIADAGTEQMWIDSDGTPYVYYTGLSGGQFREAYVYLNCHESSKLEVTTLGDSEPGSFLIYKFFVSGCQVCPGGCSGGAGSTAGIAGIIIIIIVLVGVVAYFVIGAVIMKVKFNAEGSDIIPNKNFWIAMPGLIKEGFMFTFGPPFRFIRSKIRGEQGYEAQKDSV